MQRCPSGYTQIKIVFFFNSLKHFSKRTLFLNHDLKTLVPFLLLQNDTENNVLNQH